MSFANISIINTDDGGFKSYNSYLQLTNMASYVVVLYSNLSPLGGGGG